MWVPPLATVGTSERWMIVSANDDESNLTLKVFTPELEVPKDDDDDDDLMVVTI